jgi:hypothetical protein|nr:MAG TPA: hypothetical protein [Bacteriophage sp.]
MDTLLPYILQGIIYGLLVDALLFLILSLITASTAWYKTENGKLIMILPIIIGFIIGIVYTIKDAL